jgi:hypothetical protein
MGNASSSDGERNDGNAGGRGDGGAARDRAYRAGDSAIASRGADRITIRPYLTSAGRPCSTSPCRSPCRSVVALATSASAAPSSIPDASLPGGLVLFPFFRFHPHPLLFVSHRCTIPSNILGSSFARIARLTRAPPPPILPLLPLHFSVHQR